MATGRWHLELYEEAELPALVRWRPQRAADRSGSAEADEAAQTLRGNLAALLTGLRQLAFRAGWAGEPGAWATPLAEDPIAFLLDSVDEVVNVWSPAGKLLYSNRSVADLDLDSAGHPGVTWFARGDRRFERRCLAFESYGATYVLEVVRELE
jgi:hypothetical protein